VRIQATGPATLVALAALGGATCWTTLIPGGALAAAPAHVLVAGSSPAAASPASVAKAPSKPPLSTGEAGPGEGDAGGAGGAGEDTGGAPEAQVDPLVSNGLGSPTCKGTLAGELPPTSRRNCETSGFVAAPAPTGDYAFDVHIDTGLLGFSTGVVDSAIQDLLVGPAWMALVWAVHALVVMLEWCFTLDLLDSSAAIGLGGGLRQMQATFTEPWLVIALACASVLSLYHGLIRRRVADTLGEALLMGAMMVAGLAVIADPTGTVGALGQWADQASLGALAVAAQGTPASPGRALGSAFGGLFTAAIEAPWCYLEFGDVSWCREPSRLDPRLRTAASRIAAQDASAVECHPEPAAPVPCVPAGSAQGRALEHSAELLRDARSNGAIFLALPANGAARNSINEPGSLLRAICQSADATNCRGPSAQQAEFRTNGGTVSRLGGLVLIGGGLLGMLLLLGFLAVRLLVAAIFSLLYLLLAPAVVLAPAFGESGRALFRKWGVQLLAAVVSKLVFSFLLGAVLAVLAILSRLSALGWWTQWLLMSSFWWGAYKRRHQALGAPGAAAGAQTARRRSLVRRIGDVLETPRAGVAAARWAKARLSREPSPERQRELARTGRELARAGAGEQVARTLVAEHHDARERAANAPEIQRRLGVKRAQLARIAGERAAALAKGDTRRAARLGGRGERVRGEVEREQAQLDAARRTVREGERAQSRTGVLYTPGRRDAQARFLDAQAALPARGRADSTVARHDYSRLASLVGYGREEYEHLDPRRRRAARAEIDRELALRGVLDRAATALTDGADALTVGRRERRKAGRELDGAVRQRMREHGHGMPASRQPRSGVERWLEAGRADRRHVPPASADRSTVLDDAREVAARRKRQLGRDRP
jgi:hypothetical protein